MTSGHSVKAEDAVIVPAGSIVSHGPDGAVNLALTTDQIAAAPRFDAAPSSGTVPTALGRSPRSRAGRAA